MSVLDSCLLEDSIEMPEFNYICSIPIKAVNLRRIGRGKTLPNLLKKSSKEFLLKKQSKLVIKNLF
jgi:hypothetical protein